MRAWQIGTSEIDCLSCREIEVDASLLIQLIQLINPPVFSATARLLDTGLSLI